MELLQCKRPHSQNSTVFAFYFGIIGGQICCPSLAVCVLCQAQELEKGYGTAQAPGRMFLSVALDSSCQVPMCKSKLCGLAADVYSNSFIRTSDKFTALVKTLMWLVDFSQNLHATEDRQYF